MKFVSAALVCVMLFFCLPMGGIVLRAQSAKSNDTKSINDIKNDDGSPVRIACVGDSITYGTMISNTAVNAYPAKLGALLGSGYDVRNFGRPSSYLLSEDSPYNYRAGKGLCYTDLPQYQSSIDFAPNIVLIMLGTNDMMSMTNAASCEAVGDALVSLVRSYQSLSSVRRVYVMTSIFSQLEYTYFLTSDGGLQAVQKKAAEESGAEFADIYSLTKEYFDVMLHKVDRLHPDNASSNAIPRAIYSILTGSDYFPVEAPTVSGGVVYVSSEGSLSNDGLTPDTPVNNISYAAGLLRKSGGTIVVCGPCTIADNGTFMPEGDVKIKITSKYGGVDYRTSNGAVLNVHRGNFYIGMPTEFDDITIHSSNTSMFVCGYKDTVFGKNVKCTVASGISYPSIIAGHNIANGAPTQEQVSFDGECNITVNGGTWNYIRCGNRRASDNATVGVIRGSVIAHINGGSFKCSSVVSERGMEILEGTARVIVNGGTHSGSFISGSSSSGWGYTYLEINGGSFTGNIMCSEKITGRSKVLVNTSDLSVNIVGCGTNSKAYLKEGLSETLTSKFSSFGSVGRYAPVVFVADNGSGSGLSANSPLGDINEAYAKLGGNGGTIVICGAYTMTSDLTEPAHDAPVTVTQKYNGTDHSSKGALSTGSAIRKYELNGALKFENIRISGKKGAGLLVIAQYNDLELGENVITEGFSGDTIADSLTLLGGFNASTTPLRHGLGDSHITVHSGNGIVIAGMNRYMTNTHTRSAVIDIYGGEIGRIYGGNISGGVGADAYINIRGGKLCGEIDASTGTSGVAVLTAEYGDYSECPSVKGGSGNSSAAIYNRVKRQISGLLSDFDSIETVAATVYVKQGAAGSGSTSQTPTGTITAAYAKLGDNGGTIVICGNFTMQGNFTEPIHSGPVTITQKHDSEDCSDGGALSTGGNSRGYYLSGETKFENINISTTSNAGLLIIARYNRVELGEGVVCSGFTGSEVAKSLAVIGGYNGAVPQTGSGMGEADITVRSGSGILVAGLNRYVDQTTDRSAHIKICGGDIGKIYGGCINGGSGSDVTVSLEGGKYTNVIDLGYGISGNVTLTVSDGNFSGCSAVKGRKGSSVACVYAKYENSLIPKMSGFDEIDLYSEVVYLKQGAEGDGSSPESPIGKITSAYYRLGENGGTIVVMGDFVMNGNFTAPVNIGKVTVTGMYDGIDYRAGGSFSTGGVGRRYDINGPTVFENINISTSDNAALIVIANYHPIEVGVGVSCSGFVGETVLNSFAIIGGMNGTQAPLAQGTGDSDITIRSGSGMLVAGLNRYISTDHTKNAVIDIYGGEIVTLYGGNINGGVGADTTVNIHGGSFKGNVFCAYGASGKVELNISGGVFDNCKSIKGSYELDCTANIADGIREKIMSRIWGFIDLVEVGDVDLDMSVTNSDITLIVRYLCGFDTALRVDKADLTGDGKINNRDAISLVRRIAFS